MQKASFLIVTALLEAVTGVSLLVLPSVPIALLLAVSEFSPEMLLIGRIAGAALLTLSIASWFARSDGHDRAQTGLLIALLFYDAAAAALLAYAGSALDKAGIMLWPAVAGHTALAAWCAACLWAGPRGKATDR